MLIIFRHFLLAFLLVLQLFAPLVHAHAFKGATTFGVHLPELEIVLGHELHLSQYKAETILDPDTLCVSMNTGMQHKSFGLALDQDAGQDQNLYCLAVSSFKFNTQLLASVPHRVVKTPHWVQLAIIPDLAPRAPPQV